MSAKTVLLVVLSGLFLVSYSFGVVGSEEIQLVDVVELITIDKEISSLKWTSDGTKILLTELYDGSPWSAYIIDAGDGSLIRKIDIDGIWPEWSNTGDKIVFHKQLGDKMYIKYIYINDESTIYDTGTGTNDALSVWSPDGTKIAFYSSQGNSEPSTFDVYLTDGTDNSWKISSAESQLMGGVHTNVKPAWSPDGRKLAYWGGESCDSKIFIYDLNTEITTYEDVNCGPGSQPVWSPDGATLYYSQKNTFHTFPSWSTDGNEVHYSPVSSSHIYILYTDTSEAIDIPSVTIGGTTYHQTFPGELAEWSPNKLSIAFVGPYRTGDTLNTKQVWIANFERVLLSPENEISSSENENYDTPIDLCGDSQLNADYEVCDGDVITCHSITSKYYSGNAPCKNDCSGYDTSNCEYCGDGMVNGAEICDASDFKEQSCQSKGYSDGTLSCSSDCATISESNCYKCGDDNIDPSENCRTCPSDAACGSGEACSKFGQCIKLGTDANCNSIGQSCICVNKECVECRTSEDCKAKLDFEDSGKYECTADSKGRYEILIQKGGDCENYQCTGAIRKNGKVESCYGIPCQEGQCGCLEGYSAHGGVCLKERDKKTNDPCDVDFQCESDFCYNGKCLNAFLLEIKSEKEIAKVGEEIDVSISLTNTLDEDLQTQLILTVGSGVTITRSDGAEICTSSQCSTYDTVSEGNSKDIKLRIEGKGTGKVQISGEIVFSYASTKHSIPINTQIVFTQCGDDVCDGATGETQSNCCTDCGTPTSTAYKRYICTNNILESSFGILTYLVTGGILVIGAFRLFRLKYPKEKLKTKKTNKTKKGQDASSETDKKKQEDKSSAVEKAQLNEFALINKIQKLEVASRDAYQKGQLAKGRKIANEAKALVKKVENMREGGK